LNLRPLGYEPSELPSCSTPRRSLYFRGIARGRQISCSDKMIPGTNRQVSAPCRRQQRERLAAWFIQPERDSLVQTPAFGAPNDAIQIMYLARHGAPGG
jgi:hypothetical protein